MKVITEPKVYLITKQVLATAELDRFLADHGVKWDSDSDVPAEVTIETAGRICYMSFASPRPGGNNAYLQHIKEVGHGSVLEHAVWTFLVTGVSRSLTHELVRHRAGFAYSQLSQRYVDESVAEYICPDIIWNDPELREIWLDSVKHSHEAYQKLADKLNAKLTVKKRQTVCVSCGGTGMYLGHTDGDEVCESCKGTGQQIEESTANLPQVFILPPNASKTDIRKAARQAARSVLPNATETKITVTANARALRHFLEQRGSTSAEPEIRKLAGMFLDILFLESPNLFGDYYKVPLPDGTFEIKTDYKKV